MSASSAGSEHRVPPRRVATLLAGRAGFRLGAWLAGLGLLATWGSDRFAAYAGAIGVTGWLVTVSSSGTEKTALTLLPRSPRAGLHRFLLRLAVVPVAAAVAASPLALADVVPAELAAAAVYSTAIGAVAVLVAVLRLQGSYGWDAGAFALLGLAHLATVLLARLADLGPAAVLWVLAAVSCAVAAGVLVAVRRVRPAAVGSEGPSTAVDGGQPSRRGVLEMVALMGGVEVLNTLGIAVVYAVLHATAPPAESSRLYVLLLVSQAFTGAFLYLLRLAVPAASLRGAGDPATAVRLARTALGRAALVTGAVGLVVAVAGWSGPGGGTGIALVVVALGAGLAGFAVVTYASMRVETTDAHGRRLAGLAALVGLAGVAAGALVLVPRSGALGGLTAMVLGTALQAAAGWWLLRRQLARSAGS